MEDLRTWSFDESGEGSSGASSLAQHSPPLALTGTTKSLSKVLLELLRPVGRSLADWCEAPAAAHWLPVVVTAAAAADVAERERRRQLQLVDPRQLRSWRGSSRSAERLTPLLVC